jgi:PAS domain-containing protein
MVAVPMYPLVASVTSPAGGSWRPAGEPLRVSRDAGSTQDTIIFADRNSIVRLWNAGAETIFGYPVAEAIGHSLNRLIPERLRARHWEGLVNLSRAFAV